MDDIAIFDAIADPPLLTGGLTTPNPHLNALTGGSVDYLTITIPSESAHILVDGTDFAEPGYAKDGFRESEQRSTPAGVVFRRWSPRQKSNAHGLDYESWLFPGPQAAAGVHLAKSISEARPSRIDIAFDYSCDPFTTSDDVLESFRDHFESLRMTDGISGQGGINTRYIGSSSSTRRLRIYRKDLEDEAYAKLHGPTIRLEVVLKDQHAAAWWKHYASGGLSAGFAIAAAHLQYITGQKLVEHHEDVPELVSVDASPPAEHLAQWVKQNASMLCAFCDAGIDLKNLCDMQVKQQNRQARYRRKRKTKTIRDVGPQNVENLAALILSGPES